MAASAGLLLYRHAENGAGADSNEPRPLQLLIAHMGGPFWAKKHEHAWTVPKGLHESDDTDALAVAEREFAEEMGSAPPPGPTLELGHRRANGKTITIFARCADFDASMIVSNHFEMEWPPKSGQTATFPEVDRAAWVTAAEARTLLVKGQIDFVDRLVVAISPR